MKKGVVAVDGVEVKGPDQVCNGTQTCSPSGAKPPRKHRSDQWIPVWGWLESRPFGQAKTLSSADIEDWLQKNPEIAKDLRSQHSRKHLYHYIRKCFHTVRKRKGGRPQQHLEETTGGATAVPRGIETRQVKEAKQAKQGKQVVEQANQGKQTVEQANQGKQTVEQAYQGRQIVEQAKQGKQNVEQVKQGKQIVEEAKQGKQIVVLSSSSDSSGALEICGIGDTSSWHDDDVHDGRCEVPGRYNGGDGDPGPSVRRFRHAAAEGEQKKTIGCEAENGDFPGVLVASEEFNREEAATRQCTDERTPGSTKDKMAEVTAIRAPDTSMENGCQEAGGGYALRKQTGEGVEDTKRPLINGVEKADKDVNNLTMRRVRSSRSAGGPTLKGKKRTKRLKSKVFEGRTSKEKKELLLAVLKGSRGEMSKHGQKQHAKKKSHTSTHSPLGHGRVMNKEWIYLAVKNDSSSNGFVWEQKTNCSDPTPDDPEYRRFSQARLDMVEELVWPLDGWMVRVRQRQDTKQYDAYIEHNKFQMRSAKEIRRYLAQHPERSRSYVTHSGSQRSARKSKSSAMQAGTAKEGRTKDKHTPHSRHRSDVEDGQDNQIPWSKVHPEINRYNCLVALHIRLRHYLAECQAVKRTAVQKCLQLRPSESRDVNPGLEHDIQSSVSIAISGNEGCSRPAKRQKLAPWPSAEECYMRGAQVSPFPAVLSEENAAASQCVDGSASEAGERAVDESIQHDQPGVRGQHVVISRKSTGWLKMRVGGRRVPNLTAHAIPPPPSTGRADSSRPLITAWAICKASAEHEFGQHGAAVLEPDKPTSQSGSRREREMKSGATTARDGNNAAVGAKGAGQGSGSGVDTLQNCKGHQGEHATSQRKAHFRALDLLFERELSGSLTSWSQEIGQSRKRWASLCQGWYTLGRSFAGPGVWAKRASHKLLLPTWCSYTSSMTTAPTAWGSAIELQPVQKVLDLRFHPGSEPQLVSGCSAAPNELLLYNLTTGRVNELAGHNCLVQAVEYVPGGERIVSCGANIVKVWDSATGECLHSMGPGANGDEGPAGHVKNITALTVNPFQGNLVVSSGETGDTRLLLWNISSGKLISDLNASLRERNSVIPQVDALQFATPTILVCGSDAGQGMPAQVQLWDIESQSEHVTIHAHDSYIMCLDVASSGNMIVTGAGDGTTALFDARTYGGIARIPLARACEVTSVSFSPCGVYFQASCSANFSLVFDMRMMPLDPDPQWNRLGHAMIPAGQARHSLRPLHCLSHGKPMPTVQNAGQMPGFVDIGDQGVNDARWFHHSSRLVTASGNGSVAIWDVSLGEPCVKTMASHSRSANAIAIAPDDLIFASGGDDQKVVMYQDLKNLKRASWRLSLPVLQPPSRVLTLDQ